MISPKTKKSISGLKKIKGSCRGVSIKTPLDYCSKKFKEKELLVVEKEMKKFSVPGRAEIKTLRDYPVFYMTITHLIIKDVFDFDHDDIKEMGYNLPQVSFIVKTLTNYLVSTERTFKEAPKYWKRHFTVGKLTPFKIDSKKKFMILRLEEFKTHPVDCSLFEGYFTRMVEYSVKSKKLNTKETKCAHRGDPYHEFLIEWE